MQFSLKCCRREVLLMLILCLQAELSYLVVIISTYTDGTPPDGCEWFMKWLDDTSDDFRVQKTLLKDLQYAVFSLGNSLYKDHFAVVR